MSGTATLFSIILVRSLLVSILPWIKAYAMYFYPVPHFGIARGKMD
jgi:hypothetical protein